MFKRWRCYVALLLCLCCTFATLSLNTLQVNAAFTNTDLYSTYNLNLDFNFGQDSYVAVSGYLSNGSGSITSAFNTYSVGGVYHCKLPLEISGSYSGSYNPSDLIGSVLYAFNFTSSGSGFSVQNKFLSYEDGSLASVVPTTSIDGIGWRYGNASSVYSAGGKIYANYFLEFDVVYEPDQYSSNINNKRLNLQFTTRFFVAAASESDIAKQYVNDVGANQKLDSIKNDSRTTASNSTGILNQVTSFFSSFFDNIINSLKSLFIPEDGYFTNWFTRLNTLLSAKLGMLYAPFDLVISVLTALGSASTSEAGIPFPGLAWDGQVIIPGQTFYFSSLGSSFNDLREAVYFGTDVVLLFAFLVLLQRKINLVMRGSEEG